jgi:hypothetical protein
MTEDDPGFNGNPGDTYWDHYCHWIRAKPKLNDEGLQKLKPFFGWIPVETIKRTLEATTQYAKAVSNFPMMTHMVARFKFLRWHRLNEVVSMDETFSTAQAHDRSNGAMIYYGCVSMMINVYGMTAKSQALETYKEFVRDEGIPSVLHRDGAKEQQSQAFLQFNREILVKDTFTEPYNPQQNPVEGHAIRWLKRASQKLMNWTGAPDELWLAAFQVPG